MTDIILEFNINESIDSSFVFDKLEKNAKTLTNSLIKELKIASKKATLIVDTSFVDVDEMHKLNLSYRGLDKATNVLSFPQLDNCLVDITTNDIFKEFVLGDIVISPTIVGQEALEQKKTFTEHLTHIWFHGFLHLCGFDHEKEDEAKIMADLEIKHLKTINIDNPYKFKN